MTRPVGYNTEGIPVAQGVWVPEKQQSDNMEAGGVLRAELLTTEEQQQQQPSAPPAVYDYNNKDNNNKKNDGDGSDGIWSGGTGGYSLTTGQGENQSYWGRFNDPQAEVLPENSGYHNATDGAIPVATARPDDRQIRLAFIRKVYSILSAQLLVTFGICALMSMNEGLRSFALGPGLSLYYINMVLMFVLICALTAYKVCRGTSCEMS